MAVILAVLLTWLLATPNLSATRSVAAGLIVGGGLANLLDRFPDGFVTDYVVLSAGPLRTGVFNLPDTAILVGAGLWLLEEAFRRRAPSDAPSSGA